MFTQCERTVRMIMHLTHNWMCGMILCMGTMRAPEKGLIGKRLRYLFGFIVIANAVSVLIKYLHAHGLLK